MFSKGIAHRGLLICLISGVLSVSAQDVLVDKQGIMRWPKSREEIHGFGVNYTTPFAHAFRTAKKMNISIEKAIDDDVYHFARLGFDLYRVHVWDCEISDSVGNLLANEHLKLFDYMLHRMKERGMKFVLTPIAYWPNGYPEPPEKTPGFATKYGKENCLVNPEAIKAQENYLYQFLNHVNPNTGVAYKNDPDVIGFEISNEPHHEEEAANVKAFINRMVAAMRKTGCRKPILYNMSHKIHLAEAYLNSNVQGGTFQWYPTGLGAGHELEGNLLPNVDRYPIPFAEHPQFQKMNRFIYEFDAADVGRSYIYPAMARSFREAGIQLATHFAYDPTFMANVNTEYNTHYMNLAYAPQKALSLKIASEVFHQIPMNKSFGRYPANASFDGFRVNYEEDLAELNTPQLFYYTNHTNTLPKEIPLLEHIAGFGNSPVVRYEGYGAYFLDRLQAGIWRLEIMPDAIWLSDPFGRSSPKKEMAGINWREWEMTIDLPELGESFRANGLNKGNSTATVASGGRLKIMPGTYLLTQQGTKYEANDDAPLGFIKLNEFVAPASSLKRTYVFHHPPTEVSAGSKLILQARVVAPMEPEGVEALIYGGTSRPESIPLTRRSGYEYALEIPSSFVQVGFLRYRLVIKEKGVHTTYPSGKNGHPREWDFVDDEFYHVPVVEPHSTVFLFNALTDTEGMMRPWNRSSLLVPSSTPGSARLQINIEKLFTEDSENKNGKKIYDYSFSYFFGKKTTERSADLASMNKIVLRGQALNDKPCAVQVALVTKEGGAFGGLISLTTEMRDHEINLSQLQPVDLVTLPRPYPTFLPYYSEGSKGAVFDVTTIERLQFSLGPGIPESELRERHGVAIESVRLVR